MAAWGTGPFDNDDAGEFETQLAARGRTVISSALRGSVKTNRASDTWCSAAIAAAEVIAAANGHPLRGFASVAADAHTWLIETRYRPTPQQTAKAAAVVTALSERSALADLWRESGSLTPWRRTLQSLTKRLAKPARTGPPPSADRGGLGEQKPRSPRAEPLPALISRRTAKQLLRKKADGMLSDHRASSVDVWLRQLKKLTRADAASLATLPDVRDIELIGVKLPADKQAVLETMLTGWSTALALDASDSERVARVVCSAVHHLPKLRSLDLTGSDVTDADLQALAGHRSLNALNVSSTGVTKALFDLVPNLPAIEHLAIRRCPAISIAAAATYATKSPRRLVMQYAPDAAELGLTRPTPARRKACSARNQPVQALISREWNAWITLLEGHVGFGELPDIDRLAFMATQCLVDSLAVGLNKSPLRRESPEQLRFVLTAWPGIRRLSISDAKTFHDSLADAIATLTSLEQLTIEHATIGDTMAASIATLTRLRRLALVGTNISTAGLRRIASLPGLRWLTLSPSRRLPEKDILTLAKKLAPGCYVDCVKAAT